MNKNKILSKERQDDLTSMDAFNLMVEGNLRYIDAQSEGIDLSSLRNDSVNGQNPHSIVLSCIDSRVVVEQVFDQALGDIFVARVAGNFANTDIVASMEYACAVAGSKLIIVFEPTPYWEILFINSIKLFKSFNFTHLVHKLINFFFLKFFQCSFIFNWHNLNKTLFF